MAGGTVRKTHGALNGILRLAVKGKRLAVNPAAEVELPRQDMKRRRYLSGVEVEALASVAEDRAVLVHVLAYCGLRFGELAALRVGVVDVKRRRFRIEQSVTEVNGTLAWSEPKDHQRRTVPWPPFLDEEIAEVVAGRPPDDLVFLSPGGRVLRVRNLRRGWFDFAASKASVGGLTPHELRHTAASLAVPQALLCLRCSGCSATTSRVPRSMCTRISSTRTWILSQISSRTVGQKLLRIICGPKDRE